MNFRYYLIPVLSIFPLTLAAQTDKDGREFMNVGIGYTGDIVNNLAGGIETGSAYLGILNIDFEFHLWRNTTLFINGANTHGSTPSADLTGDYQIMSSIEAGNHTYLQELWLRQAWEKVEFTLGLQDLNAQLVNSDYGSLYMNSSFGIIPTVSYNVPAPIFPLTSLGLTAKWKMNEKYTLLAALFDGAPTDFAENPHNLKWQLRRDEGVLFFSEIHRELRINSLPGILKAGVYLHQHLSSPGNGSDERDSLFRNNNGLYLLMDQLVWTSADQEKKLGFFVQFGLSPRTQNKNKYYAGGGLNYRGLFRKAHDQLGIAVAHDGLSHGTGPETAVELTWNIPILTFLSVQPDIQYIINPAGTGEKLKNCLAASLRFNFSIGS